MNSIRKSTWIAVDSMLFLILFFARICFAESSSNPASGIDTGTIMPVLFTGTMTDSIPIEVIPGRKGMHPNLALTYSSINGNGWVGVGWDLEIGAIERSSKKGVNLVDGTDFVLRLAGSAIELVNTSGNEYRAKIEGGFFRIVKFPNQDGSPDYWEVYDKSGRKYTFGRTAYGSATPEQSDPSNTTRVFKWCLDGVEDTNGNYMFISYTKNQQQIYPDRIDCPNDQFMITRI